MKRAFLVTLVFLMFTGSVVWAVDWMVVKPIVNSQGYTTVELPMPSTTVVGGLQLWYTESRVFGQLYNAYYLPPTDSDDSLSNTFVLQVGEGFGYQPDQYINTDLLSSAVVGTGTSAVPLKAWTFWPTTKVLVTSKLFFGVTNALNADGGPAKGRFLLMFGPPTN